MRTETSKIIPAQSFADRVFQYRKYLLLVARDIVRHTGDAEDIVQDAMIRAIAKEDMYSEMEHGSLKAWLTTIVKNTTINHYREAKRKPTVYDAANILASRESQDNLFQTYAVNHDLHSAIAMLTEVKQRVCTMYLQGYTQKEIQADIRRSSSAVERHLRKARRLMQSYLASYSIQ